MGLKAFAPQADIGYMLRKHPKGTPPLADMLADLGNPSAAEIAAALGVSERTARQWKRQGNAPRSALLALFWVTHWGQQWADIDLYNRATIDRGAAKALSRRVSELETVIEWLASIADFGAANDPTSTIQSKYRLDDAKTFNDGQQHALATIDQAGHGRRFDRSRRQQADPGLWPTTQPVPR